MIRDDSHIDYIENDNYRSCLNEEKHERLACSKKNANTISFACATFVIWTV